MRAKYRIHAMYRDAAPVRQPRRARARARGDRAAGWRWLCADAARRAGGVALLLQHWPQAQRIAWSAAPATTAAMATCWRGWRMQSGARSACCIWPSTCRAARWRSGPATRLRGGGRSIDDIPETLPRGRSGGGCAVRHRPVARAGCRAAALIDADQRAAAPVLALDVPSRRGCRPRRAPGKAVDRHAHPAVHRRHAGLHTGAALEHAGVLALRCAGRADACTSTASRAPALLTPTPCRAGCCRGVATRHKGESGRVLCIGGDHGNGGAIVLCARSRAAQRRRTGQRGDARERMCRRCWRGGPKRWRARWNRARVASRLLRRPMSSPSAPAWARANGARRCWKRRWLRASRWCSMPMR